MKLFFTCFSFSSCFLDSPIYLYTFYLPVAAVLLFNLSVLIRVMLALRKHFGNQKQVGRNETTKRRLLRQLRITVGISFLLGLTWSVGVVMIEYGDAWIQYVFVIMTTSQGVVIFLFQCVLRHSVRKCLGESVSKRPGFLRKFFRLSTIISLTQSNVNSAQLHESSNSPAQIDTESNTNQLSASYLSDSSSDNLRAHSFNRCASHGSEALFTSFSLVKITEETEGMISPDLNWKDNTSDSSRNTWTISTCRAETQPSDLDMNQAWKPDCKLETLFSFVGQLLN